MKSIILFFLLSYVALSFGLQQFVFSTNSFCQGDPTNTPIPDYTPGKCFEGNEGSDLSTKATVDGNTATECIYSGLTCEGTPTCTEYDLDKCYYYQDNINTNHSFMFSEYPFGSRPQTTTATSVSSSLFPSISLFVVFVFGFIAYL